MRLFRGPEIRPGIARLVRLASARRGRTRQDADDEIALHLALRTEQLIAHGMAPDAARAEAERRFGPLDGTHRDLHASAERRDRRLRWREALDDLRRDVRVGLRGLRRAPAFAVTVMLCLALGVGANAASFALVEELLLRPLPVRDPGSLVNVAAGGPRMGSDMCNQAGPCDEVFSYAMFRDLERRQSSFTAIAAHRALVANVASGDRSTFGLMAVVSGSYFPTLGARPAIGRLLGPGDDRVPGDHPVAVLSYGYWTSEFGTDSSVVGRRIVVNGYPLTIVGVAPPGFDGTTIGYRPLLYVPLAMTARVTPEVGPGGGFANRQRYWLYLFARLKPGVSREAAAAQVTTVYRPILADVEAPLQMMMSESMRARFTAGTILLTDGSRGQSSLRSQTERPLLFLFAVTAIVLLIACANIANLLLARATTRGAEMAVRASLGASRPRLLAQLFTESALLAVGGGLASVAVAYGMLELIRSLIPPSGGVTNGATLALQLHSTDLAFAAAITVGTLFVFGLAPALHGTRLNLIAGLRYGAQPVGARNAERVRSYLVTTQIALAMALLVSAGLFTKSLRNIARVDLGMDVDRAASFALAPILNGYDRARTTSLFARLEERLAAMPGVTGVATSQVALLTGNTNGVDVRVDGFARGPDSDANSRLNRVGPGFFRTMRAPLLAGREFTTADDIDAPRVAIVNEAFARKFNLGRNPVGRRMAIDGESPEGVLDIEIVGLARDAKYDSPKHPSPPLVYTPNRQDRGLAFAAFYVRSSGDMGNLLRDIPRVVAELDANLPVVSLTSLARQVAENTFMDRMITLLSAGFAALATLLAAVGLYGVLAYAVAQRRREFGVRMALGASAGRVRTMVLRRVSRMAAIGGAFGLGAALFIGRAAETMLFELEGNDPMVIGAAAAVVAVVTLAAGYIPAWRASRVDPVEALRGQ